MNKILFLSLIHSVAWTLSVADPDPQNYASPKCPELDELNATTRHYLKKSVTHLVSEEEYVEDRASIGLGGSLALEDFRLLQTATDSAVCQKLNEFYAPFKTHQILDRESGKYVPAMFGVYYEVRNIYLVLWQPYNQGSEVDGKIGPPVPGWGAVAAYDKPNLTLIGKFGF